METATITALGELRDLHDVVPSPLNPRKSHDQGRLDELAASIESKGIIEPIIVRTRPGFGQLEIVAGERRYRAARQVGLKQLPVIIRAGMSDLEVLELMAIENSQRDDLHPLEEADGYLALQKLDPAYTPKAIAAKIGKSERYVQQRLQLARLDEEVKADFFDNHITAGHADLISRLKPLDQKAALKACFHNLFGEDKERGCISVRALNEWIEHNVRLRLSKDDLQTQMFPEAVKVVETLAGATPQAAGMLEVAGSYIPDDEAKKLGLINNSAYRVVEGKKDRCKHARRAFVAIGTGRGKVIEICTAKTECKTHWRYNVEEAERRQKAAKAKPGTKTRAKQDTKALEAKKKADAAATKRRTLETHRMNVIHRGLDRAEKVAPNKPSPALLRLIGWNYGAEDKFKNWRELTVELLHDASWALTNDAEYKRATVMFKAFGVDLAAIDKQLAAEAEKATQTSAAKKSAKGTKAA